MTSDIIHKSKIGFETVIPIAVILGAVTSIMVINLVWIGLAVCGIIIWFVLNIYTGTYYKITADHQLLIKCGVFRWQTIDISDIEWIKKTNELTSAPALSIDRLEIAYKGGRVLVSPRDKKKFVNDLKQVNSKIWWTN